MPELVYNVRFEVDNSGLDKIKTVVDPNSATEVANLKKEVERLLNELSKNKTNLGESSKAYREYIESVKTATAEQRRNVAELKKDIIMKRSSTDAQIQQSNAISEGSMELETMGVKLKELAVTESLTEKETRELEVTLKNLAEAQRSGVSTANRFNAGLQVVEHQAGTMNKSFSGTNQILFSFSDLVQDSTQFSQGFAQGMRAIGNNVGFTAELFANLTTNVKRHNELVRKGILQDEEMVTVQGALMNSFKGAGGALIAINAAVMVGTIVFQKLEKRVKKLNEEAKKSVDAFSDVTKEFSNFSSGVDDPFGFQAREQEISLLQTKVDGFTKDFKKDTVKNITTGLKATIGPTSLVAKGIAALMEQFPDAAFGIASTFSLVDDATIKTAARQDEFRKKLEDSKEALEQLKTAIADVQGLSTFIGLTKQASQTMLVLTASELAGVKINSDLFESRQDVIKSLENQIQVTQNLINSGTLDDEKRKEQIVLLNKQIELFTKLNDPVKEAREELEDLTFSTTAGVSEFAKMNMETQKQLDDLDLLKDKFPELAAEIDATKKSIESFAEAQKLSLGFDRVAQAANIAGVYGEIFNASKEFRIAMATVEGASAVVSTLADPSLDTFTKIATSATIAASVIKQIQQIKKTQIGGGGGVSSASSSQAQPQRGFFETDYRSPSQDPSIDRFSPARPESMGATIVLQGSLDEEVMAYKVKSGNAKIESGTTYLGD